MPDLESEVVYKKLLKILIKALHIALFHLLALGLFAQQTIDLDKKYEDKGKGYRYLRDKNYKGPKDWYGSSPSSMKNEETDEGGEANLGTGSNLSPDRIDQTRNKPNGGGNGGNLPEDPATQKADPIQLPEFDPPDVDTPDLPEIDPPTFSQNFWRTVLLILLAIAVILLIYVYIRNRKPRNKSIVQEFKDLEWNPEVITKTELELRLEEALKGEDYREGVRIYFTFILKELIRNNWIQWRKEKTNYDYLLEMSGKPNAYLFQECVRIYDLVWYGEYKIDRIEFEEIQPTLNNFYKQLQEKK